MTTNTAVNAFAMGASIVLLASFAAFITLGIPDGLLGVAWPAVRDLFARSQSELAVILLIHGVTYLLSSLVAARSMSTQSTFIPLLAAGTILLALGMIAVGASSSWIHVLLAIGLVGLGSGVINTSLNTYASQHFSARHVNWLHACYSLGVALGPLIMTWAIASRDNWRIGYLLSALGPVLITLVFLATARRWRQQPMNAAKTHSRDALSIKGNALLQIAMVCCYSGLELTLGRWGYTFLTEYRQLSATAAGLAMTCYFGSIFTGRVVLGAVVDQVGANRLLRIATLIVVAGCIALAVGNQTLTIAALAVTGLCLGPIFPTVIARTAYRFAASQVATMVAFSVAAAIAGSALIPSLIGFGIEQLGLGAVAIAAIGVATMLLLLHEALLTRIPA